jgi:hypothetical protein
LLSEVEAPRTKFYHKEDRLRGQLKEYEGEERKIKA